MSLNVIARWTCLFRKFRLKKSTRLSWHNICHKPRTRHLKHVLCLIWRARVKCEGARDEFEMIYGVIIQNRLIVHGIFFYVESWLKNISKKLTFSTLCQEYFIHVRFCEDIEDCCVKSLRLLFTLSMSLLKLPGVRQTRDRKACEKLEI